jgi:hypothetical protein
MSVGHEMPQTLRLVFAHYQNVGRPIWPEAEKVDFFVFFLAGFQAAAST